MSKSRPVLTDYGKIIITSILFIKYDQALFEHFAFPRIRNDANTRSRNICARWGVQYSLSLILEFLLFCLFQNPQFTCFVFILVAILMKIVFLNARPS